MYWANLLHFYQPHGQKREIIDAITAQCYRPVAEGILANPGGRLTINFTGALVEQLMEYGYQDVLDMYAEGVRRGQVELVGSAKFHTILPLLDEAEVRRQIEINDAANRRAFASAYRPRGIFLPEMAWDPKLTRVIEDCGFDWVLLDELAYNGRVGQVDYTKTYRLADSAVKAVFREHRLSAALMSTAVRDVGRLGSAVQADMKSGRYVVTAMDGETFGHHRIGYEQMLFEMFREPAFEMVRMSDIFRLFPNEQEVATVACTWASSEYDIEHGIQFISWNDPHNVIHQLQWELLRLATRAVTSLPGDNQAHAELRTALDSAIASDQMFWAAGRPWWMIEHIERGAYRLLEIVERVPNGDPAVRQQALELYNQIMSTAWDWQRSGKIDELTGEVTRQRQQNTARIPFKEHSLERGDVATWQAFVDLLKREEHEAAGRGDYEAAILWRDGWYKLEHKLDIYDALYIVDLFGGPVYILDKLAAHLPRGELEATLTRYQAKFNHIRGGQVEQRSN